MSILDDSPIAQHARDEIPETWDALKTEATNFGEPALERRLNRVMADIFGAVLNQAAQDALHISVINYASKKLVLDLIRPGIDFWSKQVTQTSAAERESKSWAERAKELKEMRSELVAEVADLFLDIEVLLPIRPRRSREAPLVRQAGDTVEHLTPSPFDLDPIYGPKDTITTSNT